MGKQKLSDEKTNGHASTEQTEPEFMTLSEVGRLLNKDRSTIARWVKDGLLKSVRLPSGLPNVRRSELEKFIGGSALAAATAKKG